MNAQEYENERRLLRETRGVMRRASTDRDSRVAVQEWFRLSGLLLACGYDVPRLEKLAASHTGDDKGSKQHRKIAEDLIVAQKQALAGAKAGLAELPKALLARGKEIGELFASMGGVLPEASAPAPSTLTVKKPDAASGE